MNLWTALTALIAAVALLAGFLLGRFSGATSRKENLDVETTASVAASTLPEDNIADTGSTLTETAPETETEKSDPSSL